MSGAILKRLGLAGLATTLGLGLASAAPSVPYATSGECAGYPATRVGMVADYCMGLVWQGAGSEGPRMPRDIFALDDGDWLVSDLGEWTAGRGALWRMSIGRDRTVRWRRLLSGLSMPHAIARGPDGRIYLSEMNRILTLDVDGADPQASLRTVIGGLPDNKLHDNRHPLSSFVFDANGDLLVNVGAPSDRCLDTAGRPRTTPHGACVEEAETGQVRRHAYLGNGRWSEDSNVFASGLRNSIALVQHSAGTILQAENSVDLDDPNNPFEEVNVLRQGGHYGWPYCVNMQTPLPGWSAAQARCDRRDKPVALMPPHAAPLDLMYYSGGHVPRTGGQAAFDLAWLSSHRGPHRGHRDRGRRRAAHRHQRLLRHLSAWSAAVSSQYVQRARTHYHAQLGPRFGTAPARDTRGHGGGT